MLLQRGVRLAVMLFLVQLGITACTNGGTALTSSSSTAPDANSSSSSVVMSSSSSTSSMASSSSSSMTSSRSSSSVSSSSRSSSSSTSSVSSSASSVSSSVSSGTMSIHVDGKNFKNASGAIVQLRGVNIMGMEYTAIGGWSPNDPYPQIVESTWASLHAWKVNSIRIPLNEASYLAYTCVNTSKATQNPDPGANYKTRLKQVVDRATSEGFYVILDLHITAPNDAQNASGAVTAQCPTNQNPAPDTDHSVAFWTAVATAYKGYPNVLFELFNEPYLNQWGAVSLPTSALAWAALRDGTAFNEYVPTYIVGRNWNSAGLQTLLDAIRATGATNVILESGLDYSANLDTWLTYKANDPLNQLAAVWHAYPAFGYAWGTECYTHPGWCDDRAYTSADAILAASYPVVVTEFGDQDSSGTVGSPFVSALLPKLDTRGVSYLGWTFTVSGESDNILIKDDNGTPTDGYGQYVKAHYLCRDAGTANCP